MFEIVAQTGDTLLGTDPIISLGQGPSINDTGKVALVVRDEPGIHGRIMVVNGIGEIERNFKLPPTERVGTDVQINNSDQVVWWRKIEAPGSVLDGDTTIIRFNLPVGGEDPIIGQGSDWVTSAHFITVLPWASVNNNGGVVFSGDPKTGGTVLAFEDDEFGPGPDTTSRALSGFPVYYPMISDNNRIVFRSGNSVNSPLILFTDETFNESTALLIASSDNYNAIGSKPGISDDGRVVAFMGDSKSEGPGVYLALISDAGNSWIPLKLVDISGSNPALPMRVGVNLSNPSFSLKDYMVTYMANNSNGKLSLFYIRVNFENLSEPKILQGPTILVTVGSPINGLEELGNVMNIGLYDPINNFREIVFWMETDTGTQTVVRATPGPSAAFTFGPTNPEVGEEVTFDASASLPSDPGGQIIGYEWDFGDGAGESTAGPIILHNFDNPGQYKVTLTVTDSDGLLSSFATNVNVGPRPVAFFSFNPTVPGIGEEVIFDASASSTSIPGGQIIGYQWEFGDGNSFSTEEAIFNHTYNDAGEFKVTLTVTDSNGLSSSITQDIFVELGVEPLSLELTASGARVRIRDNYSVNLKLINDTDVRQNFHYTILSSSEYNSPLILWPINDRTETPRGRPCDLNFNSGFQDQLVQPRTTFEIVCYREHGWDWVPPLPLPEVFSVRENSAIGGIFLGLLDSILKNAITVAQWTAGTIEAYLTLDQRTERYKVIGSVSGDGLIQDKEVSVEIFPSQEKRRHYTNSITWAWASSSGWGATLVACFYGGPLCPTFGVIAFQSGVIASVLRQAAIDPRDDFTIIADPKPRIVQGIENLEPSVGKTVAQNMVVLQSLSEAMLLSYARYLGALDEEALEWASAQRAAVIRYLQEMMLFQQETEPLLDEVVRSITLPNQQEIDQILTSLSETGLPESVVGILRELGATEEELIEISQAILLVDSSIFSDFYDIPRFFRASLVLSDFMISNFDNLPDGSVEAKVYLEPNILNLDSIVGDLSAIIELPEEIDPNSINISSIFLDGTVPANLIGAEVGDHDQNGILDLHVSFPRMQINSLLEEGRQAISITGVLIDETKWGGMDIIHVVGTGLETVNVPQVVLLLQTDAEAAIVGAGLTVGTVTTQNDNTVPVGDVISQDPTAGAEVIPGSSVNLVVSSGPPPVAVPDVVGLSQADAEAVILGAGLIVGSVTTQTSDTVPVGNVITQNPNSGADVTPGSPVNLVISSGSPPVAVPDVVGFTQADAEAAIVGAGLAVGSIATQSSISVPAGNVISQDPTVGAEVTLGSLVDLVVSSGPPPVVVPDVVGLTQADAEETLFSAGLIVGSVATQNSNTVPVENVISQNPTSGDEVLPGSSVNLVVSSGPAKVAVPNVFGKSQTSAEAILIGADLNVGSIENQHSDTSPVGEVIGQSPSAGTQVSHGTAVNLVISLGPVEIPVPDLVGLSRTDAEFIFPTIGLSLGSISEESSETVPPGHIIRQISVAGSNTVSLVVSSGKVEFLLGDLNEDNCVDRTDYEIIVNDIRGPEPHDPEHDLNDDGLVNLADARTLIGLFTNPRGAPCNSRPIADAGPDETAAEGGSVGLDGSSSSDPEGDPLTFQWEFIFKTAGSTAILSDPTAVDPSFTADLPGAYVVRLVVHDGFQESLPDIAIITTEGDGAVVPIEPAWRREGYDLGATARYPFSSEPNNGSLTLLWVDPTRRNASVLTEDLNGDGILDVVSSDGNALTAFNGQGEELWSVQTSATLHYIGDINGDDVPEIFVTYRDGANHLKVDIYNADGSFNKTLDRGASGFDSFMSVLTHFDDNLIVGYGAGYALQPRGAGILSYESGTEVASYLTGGGGIWGTFAIGDADQDGRFEIGLPWGTPHNLSRANDTTDFDLFGGMVEVDLNPNSTAVNPEFFKLNTEWNPPTNPNGTQSAMMPDLNMDGTPEIFFLEGHDPVHYQGFQHVYRVSPNGELEKSWQGEANNGMSLGAVVNDLNNDGVKELLVSGHASDRLFILDGADLTTIHESEDAGRVLATTDLNGDGRDEVIAHNARTGDLRVLDATTLGEITKWTVGPLLPISGDQQNRFAISDVTGDGYLELIVGASGGLCILSSRPPPENTPIAVILPKRLDFGEVLVDTSVVGTLTARNVGTAPLEISNIQTTGPPFRLLSASNLTIGVGDPSQIVSIEFAPTSPGPFSGEVTLITNTGPIVIPVTGIGVLPPEDGNLLVPMVVDFGNVPGDGQGILPLTLSNDGDAPLTLSDFSIDNPAFELVPSPLDAFPLTLDPGESINLPVIFNPPPGSEGTTVNGTLLLFSDDPAQEPIKINLSGTSTPISLPLKNNTVLGARLSEIITAENCGNVGGEVHFTAEAVSSDTFRIILTDQGEGVTESGLFQSSQGSGTVNFDGINACGLADGIITVRVDLNRGGMELQPFFGTPGIKNTSNLPAPVLDPLPLITVLNSIEVCGSSRENTTVSVEGGAHTVSTVLGENETRFCLDVPLRKNTQNTLIVSAIDHLAQPPWPIASALPVQVFQVDSTEIVIAKAFSRPLTTEEIDTLVANGVIDLNDPSNFNVSMFTIVLTIGSFPVTITQPVLVNSSPGSISFGIGPAFGSGGWSVRGVPLSDCNSGCIQLFVVSPPGGGPVIPGVIIIDGRIKTLKEFFQVTLAILNNSASFDLTDVQASIDLPPGLTPMATGIGTEVASVNADGEVDRVAIPPIGPGETGAGQFIIRGDTIGTYSIDVDFNGFITGGGLPQSIPFSGSAGTTVQVLGPPELGVVVRHPSDPFGDDVIAGQIYPLIIEITNLSNRPALYTSLELFLGSGARLVDEFGDLIPDSNEIRTFGHIQPGQTVSAAFLVEPLVTGEIIACQAIASENIFLTVDTGPDGTSCNTVNTYPANFVPLPADLPPTVIGINPLNGQPNMPVTTSVVAVLSPQSNCLVPDQWANVVVANIDPLDPSRGLQVISADLVQAGTFYLEELDTFGNPVRHIPTDLTVVHPPAGGTTIAVLRLGLDSPHPNSQYFLSDNTTYRATLVGGSDGVCSMSSGAPMENSFRWTFSTEQTFTLTPPQVTLVVPQHGSIDRPLNQTIVVDFTNRMNPGSFIFDPANLLNSTFGVYVNAAEIGGDLAGGVPVAGTGVFSNFNRTLTYSPSLNLPENATVHIRLTDGLKDIFNNPLQTPPIGVKLFHFETADFDTSPPLSPVINPIAALTNEATVLVTGSAEPYSTVNVTGGATPVSVTASEAGLFAIPVPLALDTINNLQFQAVDSFGNASPFVGTDSAGNPTATTNDRTPPEIIHIDPSDGSTGVLVGTIVSVSFNEPIEADTVNNLNFSLENSGPVSGAFIISESSFTFTPDNPLEFNTEYTIRMRAGGIHDSAGNGISGEEILRFTTEDSGPPIIDITLGTPLIKDIAIGNIGTVAGGGGLGDGLPATDALLILPHGVARDGAGNLFIADTGGNRIRRIDASTGIITTVAGTDRNAGFSGDGGLATNAQLANPFDVAADGAGNLFIVDYGNSRIRRVDAVTRIITTVAGGGGSLGDGGLATNAQLSLPEDIALDGAGNLFIADTGNNRIRRVDASTGIITTVAGNGTGGFSGDGGLAINAQLGWPMGIALDGSGNLFIATGNRFGSDVQNRIRRVDANTGIITTFAGTGAGGFSGDGGLGTNAQFNAPRGMVLDGIGNLFVSDSGNHRVRRIDAASGIITTVAGTGNRGYSGDGGLATSAQLGSPEGLALDETGNLLISDFKNHRIRRVDSATGFIHTVVGKGFGGLATDTQLYSPTDVNLDGAGNLFISDSDNNAIRRIDTTTNLISTVAGTEGFLGFSGDGGLAINAELFGPGGTALDTSGNLFISDFQNSVVRRVDAGTGIITIVAGMYFSPGFSGDGGLATDAELAHPWDVIFDRNGNLLLSDWGNNRIRRVDAITGIITTVVGTGTSGFSGDGGLATNAQLSAPRGLAFDQAGNLFIADSGNNRIRRVDAISGIITTVVGTGTSGFSGDGGLGTNAQLANPFDVAMDIAENLLVADSDNNRIRRVDAITGIITTVAGNGTGGFSGDGGLAINAELSGPLGVDLDGAGNLLISDTYNNRIRAVRFSQPTQLDFVAISGGENPPNQLLIVTNIGGGTLNFQAVPDSTPASWLSVTPSNGSLGTEISSVLSVSVDTTGLAVGTFNGSITITDPAAPNSPQIVSVTLTIGSGAGGGAPPPPSINAIVNPSFEDDGEAFFINNPPFPRNPIGWTLIESNPNEFAAIINEVVGVTDGRFTAQLFTGIGGRTYQGPESISLTQQVDLTDVDEIWFDALTNVPPGSTWQSIIKASFLIGGVEQWSTQSAGTFLNQRIDTSSFTSNQTIEFKLEALSGGLLPVDNSNNFYFDNLRAFSQLLISDIPFADPNLASCVNALGLTFAHEVTALTCTNQNISELSGIEFLTQLTYLDLTNNAIVDLGSLSSLINLTLLWLPTNSITDVGPLSGLINLTDLSLSQNNISDVSPLSSLTKLRKLFLRSNNISDVSPLSTLTSLDNILGLDFNNISDVTPLSSLTNLPILTLSDNNIMTGVASLVTLTSASSITLDGNNNIPCADLDILIGSLGAGFVSAPDSCDSNTSPPFGSLVPDQSNDPPTDVSFGCGDSGQSLFQSFTPSVNPLVGVDLRLRAGGNFPTTGITSIIKIRSTSPGGTVVGTAQSNIGGSIAPGSELLVRYIFPSPLTVNPGTEYFIEWLSPAPAGEFSGVILTWMGRDDDPYPLGNSTSCSGSFNNPTHDLNFITYTTVPPQETLFEWDVSGDLQGWEPNTIFHNVAVVDTGGNPNGYLYTFGNSTIGIVGALTESPFVTDDLSGNPWEVSFDLLFISGTFDDVRLRFRFQDATQNGWHKSLTNAFPLGQWTSFNVTIDPTWSDAQAMAEGWVKVEPSGSWSETMSNVYTTEIRMLGQVDIEAGIDNFQLKAIP